MLWSCPGTLRNLIRCPRRLSPMHHPSSHTRGLCERRLHRQGGIQEGCALPLLRYTGRCVQNAGLTRLHPLSQSPRIPIIPSLARVFGPFPEEQAWVRPCPAPPPLGDLVGLAREEPLQVWLPSPPLSAAVSVASAPNPAAEDRLVDGTFLVRSLEFRSGGHPIPPATHPSTSAQRFAGENWGVSTCRDPHSLVCPINFLACLMV